MSSATGRAAAHPFHAWAGALWLLAGAAFGYLGLVQLGFTGEYAVADLGSAALNAVAAFLSLAIGAGLIRRASPSGSSISGAFAAAVVVAGGYQLTQGVGGVPLVLAVVVAALAGCISVLALTRTGRSTAARAVGGLPAPSDGADGQSTVASVPPAPNEALPRGEAAAVISAPLTGPVSVPSSADRVGPAVASADGVATEPRGRISWSRADAWAVLGLVILGVVLPGLLALVSGALVISHNDDWTYRSIALKLFQTGRLEYNSSSWAMALGQVLASQPFLWLSRGAPWAFAATTAAFAVVGIAAAYGLARRLIPTSWATLAVSSALLFPGFLVYTTSFMTDVPAFGGEMLSLALGAIAIERHGTMRWRWLASSLVVGWIAFSIREFAIAAPAAVIVVAAASEAGRRRAYLMAGAALVAACAATYFFAAHLPGHASTPLAFAPTNLYYVRYAAVTLGLALSPALVLALAVGWRNWRAIDFAAGALAGIVLYRDELQTVATTWTIPRLLLGNLLEPLGAPGGVAAGYRPVLLGSPIWDILNLIGLASVIVSLGVLAAVLGRWVRSGGPARRQRLGMWLSSTEGLLATFALLYGGGLIAFGLVGSMYDRYVWPLCIPLTGLLLRPLATRGPGSAQSKAARFGKYVMAGVLAVILAWTSSALLLNAFAFDAAGWRMGDLAVEKGFPAQTVDAGMAWVGYYATGVPNPSARPTSSENWYDAGWPSFKLCAMVSSSPLNVTGFQLVAADLDAYRLFLVDGDQEPMYLYRVATPGCP
jgi:hypothetical protein